MLEWVEANAALVQSAIAAVSALVWVVYLQLFLASYMRQRRPEILISRGAGVGMEARCFVANLGFEPIYISQFLMCVSTPEGRIDAAITDREALSEEEMRDPKQATNQGPLKSGDSFDAGSFDELMRRTLRITGHSEDTHVESFELTVVALHAASAAYIGALRRFDVIQRTGQRDIVPEDLETRQIRTFLARHRLKRRLQRNLKWFRS